MIQDALAPYMSLNTLEFHWGKHHRAYVDNLNKQVLGTELGALSLEDVIVKTYNNGDLHPAFNNAAQVLSPSLSCHIPLDKCMEFAS